jgi:Uma2 family endonuclease
MATAVEPKVEVTKVLEPEQRVVLRDVGWNGYETLLALVGDGHVRLTFDGKDVELMSPRIDHEEYGKLIARIIETVTEELDLPCRGLRSTTWRKQAEKRGLEADECFYLANVAAVRGLRKKFDLNVVPPPDLAIEIEITHSALDRMEIYAKLGIPEVWRFDGETLTIHSLRRTGKYAVVAKSPGIPAITPAQVVHWVDFGAEIDDHTAWARKLRQWVRAEIVPRHKRGQ